MEEMNAIAYGLNIIGCLWSCILLFSLRQLRETRNPKYRLACRILALASLIVAMGHTIMMTVNGEIHTQSDICSFPIILIASLQALLFTTLLLLLISGSYVTGKNILRLGSPALLFTLLYIVTCLLWDDKAVYNFTDWSASLSNPPLLVRSLFTFTYAGQIAVFTIIFFREHRQYRLILEGIGNKERHKELRWVTAAFCSALFIGICALILALFPDARLEAFFILIFAVFYPAFTIQYANFHYTYEQVRQHISKSDTTLPPPPAESEMDELITYLEPMEYNQLFNRMDDLLKKERLHLDPNFKRSELMLALGTNERYLAVAVGRATGLTVQEYLLRLRIRYAMDELLIPDDDRTIEQIAFDSGFTTKRTFLRNFIRLVKQRPNEYRKQHRMH